MRYDTSQVLALTGITKETLRHWKRVLPPLFGRDGRSEGYTFQEVLALAIIARAVQDLSVPISRFTAIAERLFTEVAAQIQPSGRSLVLCITRNEMAFAAHGELPNAETIAIVRVEPIANKLGREVSEELMETEAQLDLPLGDARIVGLRALRFGASAR
jgi:DNA-binding transcriptional MerR regulator